MNQETAYKFFKFDCIISSTTKVFQTRTSEVTKISVYDRAVWNFMLCRFEFFKSEGLKYFESQVEISKAIGCSVDTVQKSIKKLKQIGIIDFYKEKGHGHITRNIYNKVLHPSSLQGLVLYDIQNNLILHKDFRVNASSKTPVLRYDTEEKEPF